jgi:hypothetical protein
VKLRVALTLLCGAVLFAGGADAQVSVQVVPDNGSHPHPTARLINTSGHTVTFTVINSGTIDTRYAISCTRTGSVTSVSCSPTSPLIAEGDSRVITATFAVGSAGTGRITLTATATQPTGASAVGGWDITVANPAASVTPDNGGAGINPGSGSVNFTVTNTGAAATTFSLTAGCSGTAVTGCSPAQSSVTLAGGAEQNVAVNVTGQAHGTSGKVVLRALYGGIVRDTGYVNVVVAGASVTPDATPVTLPPNSSQEAFTFAVRNTGTATTTYALTIACSGTGIQSCSGPSSLQLASGIGQHVTVSYGSLSAGLTGKIVVRASFGGVVLDSGFANITVAPAGTVGVLVTPDNGTNPYPAPSVTNSTGETVAFTVRNTGNIDTRYAISCSRTGNVTSGGLQPSGSASGL